MNKKTINLGSITFGESRVAQKKKSELLIKIKNKNIKKKKISIYEFRGIDLDGRSRFWGRGKTKAIAKEQCQLAAKEYLIRQGISLAHMKDYTFKDIGLIGYVGEYPMEEKLDPSFI